MYASYSELSQELKNGIEILVGRAVFKLCIKTVKMLLGSNTQEPLGLPKCWCYFEFLQDAYIIFEKVLIILTQITKHANLSTQVTNVLSLPLVPKEPP